MTQHLRRVIVSFLLAGTVPIALHGQRVTIRPFVSARLAPDTVFLRPHRSPVGAGVLSYILPGVGSYYAGHTRHGTTHLVVALGLISIAYNAPSSSESSNRVTGVTLLTGYAVNWGWSIVSAVRDARANNRAETARP